jgi:hypothetical protein
MEHVQEMAPKTPDSGAARSELLILTDASCSGRMSASSLCPSARRQRPYE